MGVGAYFEGVNDCFVVRVPVQLVYMRDDEDDVVSASANNGSRPFANFLYFLNGYLREVLLVVRPGKAVVDLFTNKGDDSHDQEVDRKVDNERDDDRYPRQRLYGGRELCAGTTLLSFNAVRFHAVRLVSARSVAGRVRGVFYLDVNCGYRASGGGRVGGSFRSYAVLDLFRLIVTGVGVLGEEGKRESVGVLLGESPDVGCPSARATVSGLPRVGGPRGER